MPTKCPLILLQLLAKKARNADRGTGSKSPISSTLLEADFKEVSINEILEKSYALSWQEIVTELRDIFLASGLLYVRALLLTKSLSRKRVTGRAFMRRLSLIKTTFLTAVILMTSGPAFGQITVNDWIVINGKVNEKVVMTAQDSKEVTWDSDDFPAERSVIVGQTFIVFPIAPGEYRIKQIQWDTKKLVKIKLIINGTVPPVPVPPVPVPPVPVPPTIDKDPDFTNRISGAYSKDVALAVGDAIRLNQLKVNYQEGYRSFMSSSTNKELMDKQGQLNQKNPGPVAQNLPSVRTEIGVYVTSKLGSQINAPPTAAGPVWLQLIDSLQRILER